MILLLMFLFLNFFTIVTSYYNYYDDVVAILYESYGGIFMQK